MDNLLVFYVNMNWQKLHLHFAGNEHTKSKNWAEGKSTDS